MRRLDEGIADLRLAQVLDAVSRGVVDKCRPSTEPSVEAGIAGSFLELLEFCSHVLLLVFGSRLDAFSQCDELASDGMLPKVVLLELLTDCDVDTLRDFVILLLLAIVDSLKRLVSLDNISVR